MNTFFLLYTRNINPEFENQIFKILFSSSFCQWERVPHELIRTISLKRGCRFNTNNLLINDKDYNFDNLSEEFIFYDIINLPDDILTKLK